MEESNDKGAKRQEWVGWGGVGGGRPLLGDGGERFGGVEESRGEPAEGAEDGDERKEVHSLG